MLFHSIGFLLIFLPVLLVLSKVIPAGRGRSVMLLLLSYLFYSGAEPLFVLILIVSSITDYCAALLIARSPHAAARKFWLSISVILNLGILAIFKYSGMYIQPLSTMLTTIGIGALPTGFLDSLVLPAGISFYTFQSMSYTIDVYRGKTEPERSLLSFCNYVAYLPQLIAGPIERFNSLAPQLRAFTKREARPEWSAGIDRLALGIAQKLLIADSCGYIVDRLVAASDPSSLVSGWAVAIGFGMQIYFDFAAYTHMAIGISLLLGVRLSENFLSPYKAESIQDFWRRWHRTLSFWFRDYLYISLGGSRRGKASTILNLTVTFLLCGLWHGAGWNFVAWGALHGMMIGCFHLTKGFFPNRTLPRRIGFFLTFTGVHFAWVPFRIADPLGVFSTWHGMVGLNGLGWNSVSAPDIAFLAIVTVATLVFPNASQRWPGRSGWMESVLLWALALFAVFNTPQISKFIYFQF